MCFKHKTIVIICSFAFILSLFAGCSSKNEDVVSTDATQQTTSTSQITTTTDAHTIDISTFFHIQLPDSFRLQYQFGSIEKFGNDFLDSCYDGWIFYKNEGGNVYHMYTLYDKNGEWKDSDRFVGLDAILGDYILYLKAPQAKQTSDECEVKGAFCTKYIDETTNYEYWVNEKTGLIFKATMSDSKDAFVEVLKWEPSISSFEIKTPA